MILQPVSFLDCFVFCIALAIHLVLNVGLWRTLEYAIPGIPFLVVEVPSVFIRRALTAVGLSYLPADSFSHHATIFEALAVRCTRYAHANLPPDVLQAFFHKNVAYPFLRFRMFRQFIFKFPVDWQELDDRTTSPPLKGIWIRKDGTKDPDIVLYYIHGGGFMMGSTHFYLEFLISFHSLLGRYFNNPAIFAIEYSLAPGTQYPRQPAEVLNGYAHALSVAKSASRVCVMGDSAGGSLGLTLLSDISKAAKPSDTRSQRPAYMVLISPWMTLVSDNHHTSTEDYLSVSSLHKFARLYAPDKAGSGVVESASASVAMRLGWKSFSPQYGYFICLSLSSTINNRITNTTILSPGRSRRTILNSHTLRRTPIPYRTNPGIPKHHSRKSSLTHTLPPAPTRQAPTLIPPGLVGRPPLLLHLSKPTMKTKFPTARIKRIMQADEEVGKVAQQTPIAVGKALELFMISMVSKSADLAKEKGQKRVTANMLKQVVETDEQFDFLRDIVAKVESSEDKAKNSRVKGESESDEEAPAPKRRGPRGGRKKKET
ncbi:uncharacterized protein DNG_05531 [Cephalotrichum gorgonifer]|uniref:Transcription factor CBF/NF-Y/archaeal histone domain-containing protein n=1 Tax=Cephalotrichum gorgonifer TaxID=2041049 RepID=A0AAE8MZU6_9PEZI|nr:uncharacterized protein DNG_05531 [Cephalotrichum gorgonifer]